ncbi:hypothetical protein EM4838_04915 [Enterococcus mundtii]|uniref:Uncharacterized protein n=1 Tax=Enterococcus mundtii TaxID=53346 RepID=A0ABQ0V9N7_ENTMU|nr:hypothetical protein EM4838_04915 [Enterococcus mundtii]GEL79208.1 hypothetical protein EMU01_03520 [Enterococcus mundtii]GEN17748.1 hypothetical protein LAC02_10290 [Ligilactobacillus acidipiscis]
MNSIILNPLIFGKVIFTKNNGIKLTVIKLVNFQPNLPSLKMYIPITKGRVSITQNKKDKKSMIITPIIIIALTYS